MAMYHANHPDGSYEMANRVATFEAPRALSWAAVPPILRERITFPPFPVEHLTNSLRHLADLAAR
jgi:hypothetical protein